MLNHNLLDIHDPASAALADLVRLRRTAGQSVIALQTGDSDMPTPAAISLAALRAIQDGHTHYTFSRGLPELRQAITDSLTRQYSVNYDPDQQVLVTSGAVHAIYCGLSAILNPEDEVLVPSPSWSTYANIVACLGGRPVEVPGWPQDDFWPTISAWEQAMTARTVALVINSPNNPTGSVATREYLNEINNLSADHGLYVLSDEVYDHILYDGAQHTCFASLPGAAARTLLVNSFSKTFAMTGWRIGYLAGPVQVIHSALKSSRATIKNVPAFTQEAAIAALTNPAVEEDVRRMQVTYARRRKMVMDRVTSRRALPVKFTAPQGAFYFFIDARELGIPCAVLAEQILDECGVALVPGSAYGRTGGGFLRMSIAAGDDQLRTGIETFLDWVAAGAPCTAGASC